MAEDVHITPEGLEAVRKEHEELVSVRRPAIASKIKAARELGDLSANFEYHAAKNEQGFMEARINELEQIIKNHVLIEKPGRSELVAMGSTVRSREDGDDEDVYRTAGRAEADTAWKAAGTSLSRRTTSRSRRSSRCRRSSASASWPTWRVRSGSSAGPRMPPSSRTCAVRPR